MQDSGDVVVANYRLSFFVPLARAVFDLDGWIVSAVIDNNSTVEFFLLLSLARSAVIKSSRNFRCL